MEAPWKLGRFGLAIDWNKKPSKKLVNHVILIVSFKFQIEIAGGDGIYQFPLKIQAFFYGICLCRCSEQKGHHFFLLMAA